MNLDDFTKEELFVLMSSQKNEVFIWIDNNGILSNMKEKGLIDLKEICKKDSKFRVRKTFKGEDIVKEIAKEHIDNVLSDKYIGLLGAYSTSNFDALYTLERKGLVTVGDEILLSCPEQKYVIPTEKGKEVYKKWAIKKFGIDEESLHILRNKTRSSKKDIIERLEKQKIIEVVRILESLPEQYVFRLTSLGEKLI